MTSYISIALCNKEYIAENLKEGKRIDQRQSNEHRPIEIEFSSDSKGCTLALGKTIIFTSIDNTITKPLNKNRNKGIIQFNVSISPVSKPYISKEDKELEIAISALLERIFIGSSIIDLQSLCILANKKLWKLDVNIFIFNDDGNIIDAIILCVTALLSIYKLPAVNHQIINGKNSIIIMSKEDAEPVSLLLNKIPISITFGILKDKLFVDPSFEERLVMNAAITVVLDINSNLIATYNVGGLFIESEKYMNFINMAMERVGVLSSKLHEIIQKHENEQLILNHKTDNDDAFLANAKNKGKNVCYSKRVQI